MPRSLAVAAAAPAVAIAAGAAVLTFAGTAAFCALLDTLHEEGQRQAWGSAWAAGYANAFGEIMSAGQIPLAPAEGAWQRMLQQAFRSHNYANGQPNAQDAGRLAAVEDLQPYAGNFPEFLDAVRSQFGTEPRCRNRPDPLPPSAPDPDGCEPRQRGRARRDQRQRRLVSDVTALSTWHQLQPHRA